MRLSHRDLKCVLDAVGILTADDDPATLPARTNDSVKYLISTDVLSFEGFGTDNDYQGPLWYTPAGSVSNELLAVMARNVEEQPFIEDVVSRRISDAVRVSDYMPLSTYKKTTIYNEFFREIDTDQQLVAGLHVTPQLMVTVSLCRLKTEFTERDCNIFDLFTPHLVSAFRNAQFINRLRSESEQLQVALESTQRGVITLDPDLNILVESPTARKFLNDYFQHDSGSLPR